MDRETALRQDIEQIIGWAKSGKGARSYTMSMESVDHMAGHIVNAAKRILPDVDWAAHGHRSGPYQPGSCKHDGCRL